MKKDDILVSSWGYGQTNIDFYIVVGVTPKSVKIVSVRQTSMKSDTPMSEFVVPNLDMVVGLPMTKRVKLNRASGVQYITINDFANAYVWSGEPMFQSHWY